MYKKIIIFITLLMFFNIKGFSQEDENKSNDIKVEIEEKETAGDSEIVVSADRYGKEKKEIPLAVTIISKDDIEKGQYTSFGDMIGETPSIYRNDIFFSSIYMRGVDGDHIVFLKDGFRIMDSTPGNTRGQQINNYDIEKIEIIRGPGSVIYGSGAITGIINVVTKDVFAEKGLHGRVASSYYTNDNQFMEYAGGGYNGGTLAFDASVKYRKSDDYTTPDDGKVERSDLKDRDAVFKLGYKISDNHILRGVVDLHYGGPWYKKNRPTMQIMCENDNVYHYALSYEGKKLFMFDQVRAGFYYDDKRCDGYTWGLNDDGSNSYEKISFYIDKYYGGNISAVVNLDNHELIFGADGYRFSTWTDWEQTNYVSNTWTEGEGKQDSGVTSIGGYIQDTLRFSIANIIAGIRYDWAEVREGDNPASRKDVLGYTGTSESKNAVSGNLGGILKTGKIGVLSLNAGRAFRMPTQGEMFEERFKGSSYTIGNPDLEPEYAWTFDIGYRGAINGLKWDIAFFDNIYTDLIVTADYTESTDIDYTYENKSEARIYGVEAELSYLLKNIFLNDHSLEPGLVYVYNRGDDFTDKGGKWNLTKDGTPLDSIEAPNLSMYLAYYINKDNKNLDMKVSCTHYYRRDRVEDEADEMPSYTLCSFSTGFTIEQAGFFKSIRFNFKIDNITNEEYYYFASDAYPAKGRDYRFSIAANF